MIPQILADTTEQDLLQLIKAEVPESKSIEYKREVALGSTDQKRKFIRSIASFANAAGGEMVFGIEADKGKPISIIPLKAFSPDADLMTLRDLVRAHLDPPPFGVEYQPVAVQGGSALVIRVARSLNPPHMVTFDGDNRFYARDGNGCVPMNIAEIRGAFFATREIKDRIQRFRLQRISLIREGQLAVKLPCRALSVFHALPFKSFTGDCCVDVSKLQPSDWYPPSQWRNCGRVYDIDGTFGAETQSDGTCENYIFVNESGCVEATTGSGLPAHSGKWIGNPAFEQQWVDFGKRCIGILRRIEIPAPTLFALTLINADGHCFYSGPRSMLMGMGARPIASREVFLPPVVATSLDRPSSEVLKPIFDALWRCCGLERSFNFDESGTFRPKSWD